MSSNEKAARRRPVRSQNQKDSSSRRQDLGVLTERETLVKRELQYERFFSSLTDAEQTRADSRYRGRGAEDFQVPADIRGRRIPRAPGRLDGQPMPAVGYDTEIIEEPRRERFMRVACDAVEDFMGWAYANRHRGGYERWVLHYLKHRDLTQEEAIHLVARILWTWSRLCQDEEWLALMAAVKAEPRRLGELNAAYGAGKFKNSRPGESSADRRARIADEVRRRWQDGTSQRMLAREYGVSQATISRMVSQAQ